MRTGKINSFVICPLSFVLILLSFVLFLSSCQRSTSPVYNTKVLELSVADVSCTEAWLQLKTERTEKAENDLMLQVFRDDSLVVNKNWGAGDSLIYIDGLQPNTSYAFSAKLLQDNKLLAASPKVTATTMDTTSHDFTWQTYEFGGQGGSSSFYDVAIIDENDIWAVGEIYTADDKYNAVHWDGEKWELKKITYGGWFWTIPIVFALSHNDVWFSAFVKWNGSRFIEYPVPKVLTGYNLNKIWGTSDNDLYIVGNDGLIAHYDGRQWQRIESGMTTPVNDIWGIQSENLNKIAALSSYDWYSRKGNYKILLLSPNTVNDTISWPWTLEKPLMSIWFENDKILFIAGSGVEKYCNGKWTIEKNTMNYHFYHIRGSKCNNIFAVGPAGRIFHYNGFSWHRYTQFKEYIGSLKRVAVTNNILCTVGRTRNLPSKAVIVFGKE